MVQNQIIEVGDEDVVKYDWITLRKDMDTIHPTETFREKLSRKISENPFVPIGALCTATVLGYGLWTMKTGQHQMSQYMMRARILAQGFTIAALVVGMAIGAQKIVPKQD